LVHRTQSSDPGAGCSASGPRQSDHPAVGHLDRL